MSQRFSFCACLAFLAAAHGCVATPGRPVSVPLVLALEGRGATTSLGWEVQVDEAALLVAAVLVQDATTPSVARLEALLLPRALAHGGHAGFDETVLAAWAGPEVVTLDAASEGLSIEGRAGTTDRLALVLGGAPPADPSRAALLGGFDLRVRGTAARDGVIVPFAGGVRLPDAESERLVEGVPLLGELDEGAAVRVAIELGVALDAVRFERLPAAPGSAPIAEGTQAALALRLGVLSPNAYVSSWFVP